MPDVARGWDISEDGRTYRFHLRATLVGREAADRARLRVLLEARARPRTASKYATFLYPLEERRGVQPRAVMLGGLPAGGRRVAAARAPGSGADRSRRAPAGAWAGQRVPGRRGREARAARASARGAPGLLAGRSRGERRAGNLGGRRRARARRSDARGAARGAAAVLPRPGHVLHGAAGAPARDRAASSARGKNPDLWTRPEHIVSNGAYVLTE